LEWTGGSAEFGWMKGSVREGQTWCKRRYKRRKRQDRNDKSKSEVSEKDQRGRLEQDLAKTYLCRYE